MKEHFYSTSLFIFMNRIYYLLKRESWVFDISRYLKNFNDVTIDRPIFLLGTQGSGLTLISRMLRRNKSAVSVTGNYRYWAGADEMKSVLGPILPVELKAFEHIKPYPPLISIGRQRKM